MLAPVAAAVTPGIHALLGPEWSAAAELMPWLCLGLAIQGPAGVVVSGYLMADDAPGAVLVANLVLSAVMLGLAAPLLPIIGPWGLAVSMVASSIVGALALDRALSRRLGVRTLDRVLPAVLCGVGAVAVSTGFVAFLSGPVPKVLVGAALSFAIYISLVRVTSRDACHTIFALTTGLRKRRPITAPDSGVH
jgi:O-antigen/teichoic acid export membrane protein